MFLRHRKKTNEKHYRTSLLEKLRGIFIELHQFVGKSKWNQDGGFLVVPLSGTLNMEPARQCGGQCRDMVSPKYAADS